MARLPVLVMLVFMFLGCSFALESYRYEPGLPSLDSSGVILHGCYDGKIHDAWLENANDYPVRIRRVLQNGGEVTEAIDFMGPRGRLSVDGLVPNHGFYVYSVDGVLVGFLRGRC